MEITEVRIKLIESRDNKDNIRAFASITIDNCFVVRGLKIIEKDRFYVIMPNRQRKDGSFADVAFPINNETRINIKLKVLNKYEEELNKMDKL